MRFYQIAMLSLSLVLMSQSSMAQQSITFFVSNNTKEISLGDAFQRLTGSAQDTLEKGMIHTLQKYHFEQGNTDRLLGTYQMNSDGETTADNTQTFTTSPYQFISTEQSFQLAQTFARQFRQESVAVFIPSSTSSSADAILRFKSVAKTIDETIQLLREKLPESYEKAFSLHLVNTAKGYDNARVQAVEWLGGAVQVKQLQAIFPNDSVTTHRGQAYLVYQDGHHILI